MKLAPPHLTPMHGYGIRISKAISRTRRARNALHRYGRVTQVCRGQTEVWSGAARGIGFTFKNGHHQTSGGPFSYRERTHAFTTNDSFIQSRCRQARVMFANFKAQSFRGLGVVDEFEFGRLLQHRQVCGLFTLEELDQCRRQAVDIRRRRRSSSTADIDEFTLAGVNCWNGDARPAQRFSHVDGKRCATGNE